MQAGLSLSIGRPNISDHFLRTCLLRRYAWHAGLHGPACLPPDLPMMVDGGLEFDKPRVGNRILEWQDLAGPIARWQNQAIRCLPVLFVGHIRYPHHIAFVRLNRLTATKPSAPPQVSVTRWMPSVQRSRLYRRQVDHAYLDVSCGAARQIQRDYMVQYRTFQSACRLTHCEHLSVMASPPVTC